MVVRPPLSVVPATEHTACFSDLASQNVCDDSNRRTFCLALFLSAPRNGMTSYYSSIYHKLALCRCIESFDFCIEHKPMLVKTLQKGLLLRSTPTYIGSSSMRYACRNGAPVLAFHRASYAHGFDGQLERKDLR